MNQVTKINSGSQVLQWWSLLNQIDIVNPSMFGVEATAVHIDKATFAVEEAREDWRSLFQEPVQCERGPALAVQEVVAVVQEEQRTGQIFRGQTVVDSGIRC
ncbi:hypothetical protein Adt_18401 [Abeliophyllum distichum]|uniref:Uncharacterized protein n=1 Tax=Abeliophyllum distichum TaxID=126358 RepID=A0ABD1TJ95_9LAMI